MYMYVSIRSQHLIIESNACIFIYSIFIYVSVAAYIIFLILSLSELKIINEIRICFLPRYTIFERKREINI